MGHHRFLTDQFHRLLATNKAGLPRIAVDSVSLIDKPHYLVLPSGPQQGFNTHLPNHTHNRLCSVTAAMSVHLPAVPRRSLAGSDSEHGGPLSPTRDTSARTMDGHTAVRQVRFSAASAASDSSGGRSPTRRPKTAGAAPLHGPFTRGAAGSGGAASGAGAGAGSGSSGAGAGTGGAQSHIQPAIGGEMPVYASVYVPRPSTTSQGARRRRRTGRRGRSRQRKHRATTAHARAGVAQDDEWGDSAASELIGSPTGAERRGAQSAGGHLPYRQGGKEDAIRQGEHTHGRHSDPIRPQVPSQSHRRSRGTHSRCACPRPLSWY